jgi:photosystem II PsbZ protein
MVGTIQIYIFIIPFIIVSFAMVIGVPVVLATPGEWEKSQNKVWAGAGLWSTLVILMGISSTFAS